MGFATTVIDWSALGKVVLGSVLLGTLVTAAFSTAILGATRAAESRRDGRSTTAVTYLVLAGFALAVCVAAVVLGIVVMTTKK